MRVRTFVIFPPPTLTSETVSDSIERVKWFALFALLAFESSCTTLANRRDLYSPQPGPDLDASLSADHLGRRGAGELASEPLINRRANWL
jgi:hypothetical protein